MKTDYYIDSNNQLVRQESFENMTPTIFKCRAWLEEDPGNQVFQYRRAEKRWYWYDPDEMGTNRNIWRPVGQRYIDSEKFPKELRMKILIGAI